MNHESLELLIDAEIAELLRISEIDAVIEPLVHTETEDNLECKQQEPILVCSPAIPPKGETHRSPNIALPALQHCSLLL